MFSDPKRYKRLVGKLIYLTVTRVDIVVVGFVSGFLDKHRQHHKEVVFYIMRYLKSNPGRGFLYKKNGHANNSSYFDVDYVGHLSNKRSTSR